MKDFILWAVIFTSLVIAFIFIVPRAMDRSARTECLQWKSQEQNLIGFYLTKWQSEQCNSLGIIINAPVK